MFDTKYTTNGTSFLLIFFIEHLGFSFVFSIYLSRGHAASVVDKNHSGTMFPDTMFLLFSSCDSSKQSGTVNTFINETSLYCFEDNFILCFATGMLQNINL